MAASAPFGLQLFNETAAMAVMAMVDNNLLGVFIFERLIFVDCIYFSPSLLRWNSNTFLASSVVRFWFGMRTRHSSSNFWAAGSFSSIMSTLVIMFMIHSG